VNSLTPRSYTDDDVRFLTLIANHVGIALERAGERQAVQEAERKQRQILDHIDEIVYMVSSTEGNQLGGNVEFVSDRVKNLLGYDPEEFSADPGLWFKSVHLDDVPALSESAHNILATRKSGTRVYRLRHKGSGEYRWMEDRVVPQLDDAGNVIGIFGVARDITERKRTEEALARSEQRFRELVQSLDVIVWEADATTWKFTFVSQKAESILGYPVEQWLTEPEFWVRYIHLDDREQAVAFCQAATAEGRDHVFEYRALAADGHVVWLRDIVHVVKDEEGRAQHLRGVMVDITAPKRAEETLHALYRASLHIQEPLGLQERLARLLATARDVLHLDRLNILLADPEGRWLEGVAALGTTEPAEAMRVPIGTAGGSIAHAYLTQTSVIWPDPEVPVPEEFRLHPPYDRLDAFRSRAFALLPLVVRGRVIGVMGADRKHSRRPLDPATLDLLQLFAAQAALAIEQARLLEETQRQQQEAVALEAVAREITSSLDRAEVFQRIVDHARALCHCDLAFLAPCDRETGLATIVAVSGARTEALVSLTITPGKGTGGKVLETGESFTTEDYLHDPRISKDYADAAVQEGFVSQAVVPLRFRGAITGLLWVVNRRSRRFTPRDMAVLGKLADQAAIASENSRLYGELWAALEEVEASQQRIAQTDRLRALGELAAGVAHDFNNTLSMILGHAQHLLAQARDPGLQRQLQVIEKAAVDGARTVRRVHEFSRKKPARPFESVDLNCLVDEVVEVTRPRWEDEAQAKGIRYDVRVAPTPLPPVTGDPSELREALTNIVLNALDAMPGGGRLTFEKGIQGNRAYCIVADTGIGMPEEVRRRIFDPYFTTKGGRGSGLGLSVAYGIITRHGGEIEVQSQVGHGSTFTIWLPGRSEAAEAPQKAVPSRLPRKAKILVIDDERDVREVLADLLSAQGHTVVACGDGPSGLARFQGERFDLVLTDLVMPEFSGWEVAREVKRLRPETLIGLVTGWEDRVEPEAARAIGIEFLVAKPFTSEDVQDAVARALATGEIGDEVAPPGPALPGPAAEALRETETRQNPRS
jgi:PAS domain S-box-containing protein